MGQEALLGARMCPFLGGDRDLGVLFTTLPGLIQKVPSQASGSEMNEIPSSGVPWGALPEQGASCFGI